MDTQRPPVSLDWQLFREAMNKRLSSRDPRLLAEIFNRVETSSLTFRDGEHFGCIYYSKGSRLLEIRLLNGAGLELEKHASALLGAPVHLKLIPTKYTRKPINAGKRLPVLRGVLSKNRTGISVYCPMCGRMNEHTWGPGIPGGAMEWRAAHCNCWPDGYFIAPLLSRHLKPPRDMNKPQGRNRGTHADRIRREELT